MAGVPGARPVTTADWFHDAKLGVFLHWGLYSVPAWAPRVPDVQTALGTMGPRWLLANNPYAAWYLNSMAIPGSPTARHHARNHRGAPYEAFRHPFEAASAGADLGALADVGRRAGARYMVLTTKHHEGYSLWPSRAPHPTMGSYHSPRDLVGELTAEVRAAGMRMGLYYSSGFDWPANGAVLARAADVLTGVPRTESYARFVDAQWRELIDRYHPDILWSDIGAPADLDLESLVDHYRRVVEHGVVNDRWVQGRIPGGGMGRLAARGAASALEAGWRRLPATWRELKPASHPIGDFITPEYATPKGIPERKWEATRGVGHSFGANHHEPPEDIISGTELIRLLVDVVARNGNLLIGVGPRPDGTVPSEQTEPLLALGRWLSSHGGAIYGTRPWSMAATTTSEGTEVRFTRDSRHLHAVMMEAPPTSEFALRGVRSVGEEIEAEILGTDQRPRCRVESGTVWITLPPGMPPDPAPVLRLPLEALAPA